eukprot:gene8466-5942_t
MWVGAEANIPQTRPRLPSITVAPDSPTLITQLLLGDTNWATCGPSFPYLDYCCLSVAPRCLPRTPKQLRRGFCLLAYIRALLRLPEGRVDSLSSEWTLERDTS